MKTDRELLSYSKQDIQYYSKQPRSEYLKTKLHRLNKLVREYHDIDTLLMSYEENIKLTADMEYRRKAIAVTLAELNDLKP